MKDQPLIEHLIELRNALLRCVIALGLALVALLPFANVLYNLLATPLLAALPEGNSMIATGVAAPFLTPFKLALFAAFLLALPYLLWQVWRFIAPGLYDQEKRLAGPLVACSACLFYAGMAFAFFVVFPLAFAFFAQASPEGVAMMTDISAYLDFVLKLFLAFGLAFQIPIVTLVSVRSGITSEEALRKRRPYVIVGCFVLGMLLTPPDVISQTLLAVPMWILFEAGLLMSRYVSHTRTARLTDDPQ